MYTREQTTKRVKVLCIPLYRGTWLFHTCSNAEARPQDQELDWHKGNSLQDKLAIAFKLWGRQFDSNVKTQWKELQAAKAGTFRAWLFQLGQAALSKEDPTETFLKHVPTDATRVELIYPASSSEVRMRKRMRMLAMERSLVHRRRIVAWSMVTLPQLPLILTPLPNVTLYFSVYRFLSHFQALRGASTLVSALGREDAILLQKMHRVIQSAKPKPSPGSHWLPRLLGRTSNKTNNQFLHIQEECCRQLAQREGSGQAPIVLFQPSPLLDSITQPQERWHTPLSEDAVALLTKEFSLDSLSEHYARAKNRGFQK